MSNFLKNIVLTYKIPQLVRILWVDAYTIGGEEWLEKDKAKLYAKEPLPYMVTVGFVLYIDADQVAVTNTVGPGETAQVNKIPKRMIISMETLTKVGAKEESLVTLTKKEKAMKAKKKPAVKKSAKKPVTKKTTKKAMPWMKGGY